jgi:hypothetical protein
MSDSGPVKVPAVVLEGIRAVQERGLVNMFDRQSVMHLLCEAGATEAYDWVSNNQRLYGQLLLHGPLEEEDAESA